jgi:hypothetical protein
MYADSSVTRQYQNCVSDGLVRIGMHVDDAKVPHPRQISEALVLTQSRFTFTSIMLTL